MRGGKPPLVLIVPAGSNDAFIADDVRMIRRFARAAVFEPRSAWVTAGTVTRLMVMLRTLAAFVWTVVTSRPAVVVFWFAGTPSMVLAIAAKLLWRKVVLITGGWDSIYLPEIRWGQLRGPRQRRCFAMFLRLADAVLPFSDDARRRIEGSCAVRHLQTVYPAVDTKFFDIDGRPRQRRVVTCCYQYDGAKIVQKGLAALVAAARRLPELEFVILGNPEDEAARAFQASASGNVRFVGRLPERKDYRQFLQESSVYAQLSHHEGFGISLAEAMACGCIPVVFDRYSLPEVVGPTGCVVAFGDEAGVARAIASVVDADAGRRRAIRQRVVERFDSRFRLQALRRELARLVRGLDQEVVRVELGCGDAGVGGAIGVDLRPTPETRVVCDVRRTPFADHVADEVYSYCVLEHLEDPCMLLDEAVRILKRDGHAYLRVPNLGTYSAHLDPTHCFLADLRLWRQILGGYFENVQVRPLGTKYRDSWVLVAVNVFCVRVLRCFELAQGWEFVCGRPKANPTRANGGWWYAKRPE